MTQLTKTTVRRGFLGGLVANATFEHQPQWKHVADSRFRHVRRGRVNQP